MDLILNARKNRKNPLENNHENENSDEKGGPHSKNKNKNENVNANENSNISSATSPANISSSYVGSENRLKKNAKKKNVLRAVNLKQKSGNNSVKPKKEKGRILQNKNKQIQIEKKLGKQLNQVCISLCACLYVIYICIYITVILQLESCICKMCIYLSNLLYFKKIITRITRIILTGAFAFG